MNLCQASCYIWGFCKNTSNFLAPLWKKFNQKLCEESSLKTDYDITLVLVIINSHSQHWFSFPHCSASDADPWDRCQSWVWVSGEFLLSSFYPPIHPTQIGSWQIGPKSYLPLQLSYNQCGKRTNSFVHRQLNRGFQIGERKVHDLKYVTSIRH